LSDPAGVAELEAWARHRVHALKPFYTDIAAYVIVNFILFVIDCATGGPSWFYLPLTGWGLLLALHALHAYEMLPWTTRDWEQRKARDLIEMRLRRDGA